MKYKYLTQFVSLNIFKLMENGLVGVSGVNARFHVEVGNIPDNVHVTPLHQKLKAPIALVMILKQDHLVMKPRAQVSKFYT